MDGVVNVMDIVSLVGIILGDNEDPLSEIEHALADASQDGSTINVLDVISIVNQILS